MGVRRCLRDAGGAVTMRGDEFGHFLEAVEERDIDLLLMEEFHVSDEFVAWFCARLGLPEANPVGAWHSVSDVDGETDLLLCVLIGSCRVGVMIENKVGAPEQDRQAERYHLRGVRYCEAGMFDRYVTVICAPQAYLDGLPARNYGYRISYESIAEWFAGCGGRRAAWRHHVMSEAIDQGRRGYTMLVSPIHTAFHRDYWAHLHANHPRILMRRPTNKGSKSTWIIMKGYDFPKGVLLHHKLDGQVMELGFDKRRVAEILRVKSDWPEDIVPMQRGGTASLVMTVPFIDMEASVASQIAAIDQALAAARRLMEFSRLFQASPGDEGNG